MPLKEKKRVVILGSGFAGMYTALQLARLRKKDPRVLLEVVLISNVDYFWLVTLAHEVASGNLLPTDIMQPIRSLPPACYEDYIKGDVHTVDLEKKEVHYRLVDAMSPHIERERIISYDYLVSAVGSQTNFFDTPGAQEYSIPLKTLEDTKRIKNRILECFEEAQMCDRIEEEDSLLDFVIVGGGATGVEIAGEIGDLIQNELTKRFPRVVKHAQVTILQGGDKLVMPDEPWFSKKTEEILTKERCVKILYNSRVTEVTSEGVKVGEEFIPARTVIWTAGVKARDLAFLPEGSITKEERSDRIVVTEVMNLSNHKEVFVIGDQGAIPDKKTGRSYPMLAQFAVPQGKLAAKNIFALVQGEKLTSFEHTNKGMLFSLGSGALARIYGVKFSGLFAWWLYRIVYIPQLIGWRARLRTIFDWTLNLFLPRDLSEL